MFGKKNKRLVEKDYYQHTRNNRNVVQSSSKNHKVGEQRKKGPDPEWWKPASVLVGFGGPILLGIMLQYLAMTLHNLGKAPEAKTGFFHGYGFMLYYILIMMIVAPMIYWYAKKKFKAVWQTNNALWMNDDAIEERENDSYVRTMDHLAMEMDVAPDVGMGFDGHASSLVGHAMISNKGIRKVKIPVYDGTVDGLVKRDDDGNIVYTTKPMFDEKLAHKLFDMSGVPKEFRKFYDATDYAFNPRVKTGSTADAIGRMKDMLFNRGDKSKNSKLEVPFGRKPYETLAEAINKGFYELDTETARPAGVYFYDSRPVNTILIAITRGGKGQTYIEPAFDVWLREKNPWNIFTTDPKGELLAKFYYPATVRGFEVVQFNLMNPNLTNVFNPLINALQKFRQDDDIKGAALIDNIVETLFPDNGEIWNPAAGNMFRRAVYLLFDYYIEQEAYIRYLGYKNNVAPEVIEESIDDLYSKVTLYNVYVLVGELAAKISKDPKFINVDPDAPPATEKDLLTLVFDAMAMLPTNKLRNLAIVANNAIKQIASAPQTLAGIYASLLTGISVYADPTTIALMSGSISDSFDVGGVGFPRRFGVQLDGEFVKKFRVTKELARWSCYKDSKFTKPYGEGKDADDYRHEEKISESNWIFGYFKGTFPKDVAYLKLEIVTSGVVAKTFYFKFIKGYKTTGGGISYTIDVITKKKVVQGGVLVELDPKTKEPKVSEFETRQVDYHSQEVKMVRTPIIRATQSYYSERPKFIFAVTPPHLQQYQKHILIIIKQIIDEIYAGSYVVKQNKKPIVGTRFMLEEFGNIRSGENGIPNIDTITSIALGQDVQLTFVLQSFQQLRSVYGEDVEKIIRANSANIIFLKSNDEELINELVRLSGTRHEVRTNSVSVSRKPGDIVTVAEPVLNYSRQEQETTALTGNDLLFLADATPGNSITFISNEMPILNKLDTITPMAAGLHDRLPQPASGKYSDSTLPSTNKSDGVNFLENTIDGEALVRARVAQAKIAKEVKDVYLKAAEEAGFELKERNGDLAKAMMNTVYELYDKESGCARVELADTKPYYEIAQELFDYITQIRSKDLSKEEKLSALGNLKESLARCAMDDELSELTVMYTNAPASNPVGYDLVQVSGFVAKMRQRYPKPVALNVEIRDVYDDAAQNSEYTGYDSGDLLFDIRNSFHRDALEDLVVATIQGDAHIQGLDVRENRREEGHYDILISGKKIGWYAELDGSYASDYGDSEPTKVAELISKNPELMQRIQEIFQEG